MNRSKEFDIIIWGASGVTGRLVVAYLFKKYGVNDNIKWAMAGRDKKKLKQVRFEVADNSLPIMRANGVPEISLFLQKKINLDECIAKAQQVTRNYVKRQHTWWNSSNLRIQQKINEFPDQYDQNSLNFNQI